MIYLYTELDDLDIGIKLRDMSKRLAAYSVTPFTKIFRRYLGIQTR